MSRMVLSLPLWLALAVPAAAAEPVFATYRGVGLGDPVSAVVSHFKMTPDQVLTVHEPPTLVQRLNWRPRRFVPDPTVALPSLDEIEFTFHRDRLVRIVVTYDFERTEGLTDADLREAFTSTYGPPALVSTDRPVTAGIAEMPAPPVVVGQWGDGDTLVLVSRLLYPRRVVLTIASIAEERVMDAAVAEAARLDAQGAPAREIAQRAIDAELRQTQSDKARRRNKVAFTP